MKAIVIFHSLYGNTQTVAESLTKGLREAEIETECYNIKEIDLRKIQDFDFIAIGGPTHMIRPSKDMKEFLDKLKSINLRGKKGFSFDTRNFSRLNQKKWLILENSAARVIEKKMKKMKIKIIKSRESAIVTNGREGPLEMGVEETFKKVGKEIGIILKDE